MSLSRFLIRILLPCSLMEGSACTPDADRSPAGDTAAVPSPTKAAPPAPDAQADTAVARFPDAASHAAAALTFQVIDAPDGTFGYDILSDGKLFVHQTNLPGQPGNGGCRSRADAEKLAAFVIGKIKKGEMPPTVSSTELEELRIIP